MARAIAAEPRPARRERIEGAYADDLFAVKLQRMEWDEAETDVFRPDICFVNLMLDNSARFARGPGEGTLPRAPTQPGEILFVPPGRTVRYRCARGTARVLSCWLDVDRIGRKIGMDWAWPGFAAQPCADIRDPYISMALRRIAQELRAPGLASRAQIQSALLFVTLELRRRLAGEPQAGQGAEGLTVGQLSTIADLAMHGERWPLGVDDLAEACGCAPGRVSALYHAATGHTLRELFAAARIERAKRLLAEPGAPIKQVAFKSGFASPAAFGAAFRAATGLTPGGYRLQSGADRSDS
jgi:AraC family transcriptional regulator